uniref:G-protein coupled receptors family 3 profile domain-containing protein n=1 Tax=Denticeps clupeoides TaxID=299321 RepID=A0AAY4DRT5_9TELE
MWVGTEAWIADSQIAMLDSHNILTGAIGLAIPKAQVTGLWEYILDVTPLDMYGNGIFTEFWETTFNCKFYTNNETIEQRKCTGREDLSGVQGIFTDMSILPILNNVYKAVYAAAHALHKVLDCGETCTNKQKPKPIQVPVSVCSESCPPGTRKAARKGKPVCCYDCIPLTCVQCHLEFWSNMQKDDCIKKEIEYLSYKEIIGILLTAISILGSCMTSLISVIFLKYKSTPIVKANNSELSFLLLFALILCFLCALTFIGQPSDWSCMLRHTAFGITFVLCISCVLGKTLVVLMAFRVAVTEIA